MQQPEMSKDGRFIAITLRGSKRETGIWSLEKKTWTRTGEGCQINWTPDGREVYWVHPTGNGGSRVFHQPMRGDRPAAGTGATDDLDSLTLIDIPVGARTSISAAVRRWQVAGVAATQRAMIMTSPTTRI